MLARTMARAHTDPDAGGHFGRFGGRYVPEALMHALDELSHAFRDAQADAAFTTELDRLRRDYAGRPTSLWRAQRLSEHAGGGTIYLKREDLAHTGAHKINNVLGQCLLAMRMGKRRVIAETGAGQHGVATATAAALFGLECVIYMGEEDCRRQALNLFRMEQLGARVVHVTSGSQTLKDAINDALRDWVASVESTHYVFGSAAGPDPFPYLVREFQKVIGEEARAQMIAHENRLPDAVVACVGGSARARDGVAVTGDEVRLQERAVLRRAARERLLDIHRDARTVSRSLSPRPERFTAMRSNSRACFTAHAIACEDSSAGRMPSVRASKPNASSASSSVTLS